MKHRHQIDFTEGQINAHVNELLPRHVDILRAATPGKNYKAIGLELGLPQGTVKSRLSRARSLLARLVEEDEQERRDKHEMEPGGLLGGGES